ncbi:hypothetical protein EXIGLDRAFT_666792 [Exidia glandulosa HHB12029]|uniref:Protein kinase domain-containing protein n=1 Tax=Exidia glandulosa HHB12029 TaxID=1314781 RepID=A0A165NMT0_EXIGL|nr:hypothetical protein EXIGLDRAFT_666792 [Exidia glandulosa HHB12029]
MESPITIHPDISESERPWVELQPEFEQLGYRFRPRFRQGWKPSWDEDGPAGRFCGAEDAVMLDYRSVIDAFRLRDKARVVIKMLPANHEGGQNELQITRYLGNPAGGGHTATVPLLDTLVLPSRPDLIFMVLPELVRWNTRRFARVDEALNFVRQLLHGLLFMHENSVAHGDIGAGNIMMDGLHYFEDEPHPAQLSKRLDFTAPTRLRHYTPLFPKYYFIDFGRAVYNPPGYRLFVAPEYGQDWSVPEIADANVEKVDPFKVDLWSMGRFLSLYLVNSYIGLDMLLPIVQGFMQVDPNARMTASDAVDLFESILSRLSDIELSSELLRNDSYSVSSVLFEERYGEVLRAVDNMT